MQDEKVDESTRRLLCRHRPVAIEVAIAGDTYRLRSCTRCGWTEWTKGGDGEPCELCDVLARLASVR